MTSSKKIRLAENKIESEENSTTQNTTQSNHSNIDKFSHPQWDLVDKSGMPLGNNYIRLDNEIFRMLIAELNISIAGVYALLLSHRNFKSNKCCPTVETIAKEMNKDVRTAARAIKALADAGYIIIHSGKNKVASEYFFPLEYFYEDTIDASEKVRRTAAGKEVSEVRNKVAQNKSQTTPETTTSLGPSTNSELVDKYANMDF